MRGQVENGPPDEPPEEETFRAVVRGRVQGVGFRAFTKRAADRLGVRGAVFNRRDGAVGVWALGSPEAMAAFEAQLRKGPVLAKVRELEVVRGVNIEAGAGFEIVMDPGE